LRAFFFFYMLYAYKPFSIKEQSMALSFALKIIGAGMATIGIIGTPMVLRALLGGLLLCFAPKGKVLFLPLFFCVFFVSLLVFFFKQVLKFLRHWLQNHGVKICVIFFVLLFLVGDDHLPVSVELSKAHVCSVIMVPLSGALRTLLEPNSALLAAWVLVALGPLYLFSLGGRYMRPLLTLYVAGLLAQGSLLIKNLMANKILLAAFGGIQVVSRTALKDPAQLQNHFDFVVQVYEQLLEAEGKSSEKVDIETKLSVFNEVVSRNFDSLADLETFIIERLFDRPLVTPNSWDWTLIGWTALGFGVILFILGILAYYSFRREDEDA
jgi:hypothetical protein